MLSQVEQQTEQVEIQHIWQSIVEDSLRDRGRDNKRLGIVCWIMAAVIVLMAVFGLYFYDRQQTAYLVQVESITLKMEKQQKDFLDFLSDYNFESVEQDGAGYNYYNRDNQIGGDLNNGAENKVDAPQGQESQGDSN